MRIAKSTLIEPGRNDLYAMAAVALSLFVFAYSTRFGAVSILVYYALWLPLVLVDYRQVLGNYMKYIWILGFGLFCFLSVFWSAAPSVSMRASIQYLTHIVCALIAMRTLTVSTLSRGGVLGCGLVLMFSVLFGSYHYDPLDGSFSFVGAFASKNQLGFYASLGIFFPYAVLLIFRARGLWLPICGATGMLALYALAASQSATSVITTVALIGVCLGMQVLMTLSPKQRRLVFMAAMVVAIGGVVVGLQVGAMDTILAVFGKDSTLTGRTYLWQQGIEAAAQSPWIGMGYQAYWVQGFNEAERLWEEFFIGSRSGFHFHNTYIETMVEVGLLGTALLVLVLLANFVGHLKRLLTFDRNPESLALFGIASLLVVRSFVEIDIMHPFQVGSFLLYFAAGKLAITERVSAPRYYDPQMQGSNQPQTG